MTINILSTLEVKEFESEVHQVFQEKGNSLRDVCRMRTIKAKSTQFPVLGRVVTAERILGTPLVTTNQSASAVEVTVTEYSAAEYTDIFLQSEINFDAKQEAAMSVAMSLGRRLDQIIIDALSASATTKTVADNISGAADDLTSIAVRRAAKLLDDDGVTGERHAIVRPSGLHHLIGDGANTGSIDYVNIKPMVDGKLNNYYGINFHMIGNFGDEDGLPNPTGQEYTNFIFSKDAIGCAVNIDMRVEINYVPTMGAHLVTGFLSAGAKTIDDTGIVKVTTDENT